VTDKRNEYEHWWKETETGNLNIVRKACPNAALSTVNPTWNGLGVSISAMAGLL
jgi:hypothetical protein